HISLFSHLDNTPTPRCYTLSLHDALPISRLLSGRVLLADMFVFRFGPGLFGYVWLRSLSLDLTTMTDNSVFSSPMIGRQLFGPGPCNPYPEAHLALSLPLLGHLDPAFIDAMDDTSEMLRQVWGTQNQRTLPLSATGSAGMEAAFVNTIRQGHVVVVAVNGLFGER